jgi:hypothetical protein
LLLLVVASSQPHNKMNESSSANDTRVLRSTKQARSWAPEEVNAEERRVRNEESEVATTTTTCSLLFQVILILVVTCYFATHHQTLYLIPI